MLNYKLSTFLELCETKNYTKTAEKLHMTQPAVTQHIKYLEQYYGTKLFYYDEKKKTSPNRSRTSPPLICPICTG